MVNGESSSRQPADVGRIFDDLDKYAGWLGKGVEARRVREDVRALGAALQNGSDTRSVMESLEIDIEKVPHSNVGVLVRKAVRGLRLAVGDGPGAAASS